MTRILADEVVAERRTLDGVIYGELRGRIVSLDYPPGRMIYENEVAAEFGVSRTPVRQAFLRLAIDDLLLILPQRGARVTYLSRVKVREAQAVRESLEATAFAEAARRWNEDDPLCRALMAELTVLLAEQDTAVATRDYPAFTRLDEAFHNAILRFAGNLTLLQIVGEMRLLLNRVRYVELQEARHDAEAVGHHRAIVDAIRRGDAAGTTERLIAHLKMLESFRETLFDTRADMFV